MDALTMISNYEKAKILRVAIGYKLTEQYVDVYALNLPKDEDIKLTGYLNEKLALNNEIVDELGYAISYLEQYGYDQTFENGIKKRITRLSKRYDELENGKLGVYFKSLMNKNQTV